VEPFVPFMFGVLLLCLGYLLYLLVQTFHFAQVYQIASFGFGVAGSFTLAASAAVSAWRLSSKRAKVKAKKPLREALLYGVTGYVATGEPVWRTKLLKTVSGLPHTIHMICPSCNGPIHLDSKFCEFCGTILHRGLEIGFRLESMTPAVATCDNISEDLQQVYRDDGKLLGVAGGRADPLGDVLKIRTVDGGTHECEVGRLLLIPLSSVPGEFKGSLIMMPGWFLDANEVLALTHTAKSRLGTLLEELKNKKVSEKEFEKAYSTVFSRLLTGSELKKIPRLEKALVEQKAKVATAIRSTNDADAKAVLGFELRTVESFLNQIRSSRESLRGAIRRVEEAAPSENIRRLVSFIPTF